MLGFVNQIVEQQRQRVILVANEAELIADERADWERRAEKLVGRRVQIVPNVAAVIENVAVSFADDPFGAALQTWSGRILSSFERAGTGNLRSLAWSLENLRVIFAALPTDNIPDDFAGEVVDLVVAMTMELRAGALRFEDVPALSDYTAFHTRLIAEVDDESEPTAESERVDAFLAKHANNRPELMAISPEFVLQVEQTGTVDVEAICDWLRDHHGIGTDEVPVWRRLWGLHHLRADELDADIAQGSRGGFCKIVR